VVREILRVTRKGGRIVLADADYGTASVDFEDTGLERRFVRFLAEEMRPDGYAGRRLYAYLKRCGLSEVKTEIFPFVFHRLDDTRLPFPVLERLQEQAVFEPGEIEYWLKRLKEKERQGTFYFSLNMVLVHGIKSDKKSNQNG
ncbi:MAG: hypothetical protein R3350_10100, partial [Saprospiraceae bacterium]|nr:hypothetical protein [Saprospiraceae bacterium]